MCDYNKKCCFCQSETQRLNQFLTFLICLSSFTTDTRGQHLKDFGHACKRWGVMQQRKLMSGYKGAVSCNLQVWEKILLKTEMSGRKSPPLQFRINLFFYLHYLYLEICLKLGLILFNLFIVLIYYIRRETAKRVSKTCRQICYFAGGRKTVSSAR